MIKLENEEKYKFLSYLNLAITTVSIFVCFNGIKADTKLYIPKK